VIWREIEYQAEYKEMGMGKSTSKFEGIRSEHIIGRRFIRKNLDIAIIECLPWKLLITKYIHISR
jgi:hypothetical protein